MFIINIFIFGFIFGIILPSNTFALIANFSSKNSILSLSFEYSNSWGNASFYINISGSPCYLSNYLILNNTNNNLKENGISVNNATNNCSILNITSGSVRNTSLISLTFNICCVTQGSTYLISVTFNNGFNDSAIITAYVRSSAVRNLIASSKWGVNNLFVQWDRLSNVNGTIMEYLVVLINQISDNLCIKRWRLSCRDCGDSANTIDPILRNCSEIIGASFNNSDNQSITFASNDSSIGIASKYVVIVSALNGYGWGEESNISIITSEYMSGSVSNLSISSSFPSSPLIITWNPPQSPNGEIVQYFIWVQNNNSNQCVLTLRMNCIGCTNNITNFGLPDISTNECKPIPGSTFYSNTTTFSITINDPVIIACSEYMINVRPLNGYGWGNLTNKSIKTDNHLLDSVNNFKCINSSYYSILCTWSPPIVKNVVILNYQILCINCAINSTLSNTTTSINITNNIIPDVLYNIEITPNNICGRGTTTNYNITIEAEIDVRPINESQISDVMSSSTTPVKDDAHEISIILPFKHFNHNRGKILKYTVVVHQVIDKNVNPIKERGPIPSSSAYSDYTYANCSDKTDCIYEIDVTDKKNSNRRKRQASDVSGTQQNKEFTIGNTKTSNNLSDYTNNGPLKQNTEYQIAFRAYTSAGYRSVGNIRKSTKTDKGLAIGLAILCLVLIIGCIVAFILIRRRVRNNRHQNESIIIPMNQGREAFGKSPLVIDFYVNFQYMKQESNRRLINDYRNIENQCEQFKNQGILEFVEGNKSKNRYKNIKPYKHNVVKLLETNDYINASRICFKHWDLNIDDRCSCTDIYIATQGPIGMNKDSKEPTFGDFWRMIIENNVYIIVNLTMCRDDKNENCSQYWPDKVDDRAVYISGCEFIHVTLLSFKDYLIFTERTFKVLMKESEITVQQFHLESWKENSCPDIETFLQFYSVYKKAKTHLGPIVVHCSAGVGRTGTFIMIDEELSRIKSGSDRIEIFNNLLKLRTCRHKMVQSEAQYCFIYQAVYEYLANIGLVKDLEHNVAQTFHEEQYEYILE